jgi:uncharacterized protein
MRLVRIALALWLVLFAAPLTAQTFPKLTGRVVDQANLLSPAQEVELRTKSQDLEARTGRQLVIATVNSLEGRTIEDYGFRLGRTWAIGGKEEDDGVILLVAPNERKVRIETGYGATVFLTDAISSQIIRNVIRPRFKAGDMPGGIIAGADRIIETMQLSPAEAARFDRQARAELQEQLRASGGVSVMPVLFMMIIFFIFIRSMARRAGGRRYRRRRGGISPMVVLWGLDALSHSRRGGGGWGGGGGFGGFGGGGGGGFGGFSGGGGSFGGGGASGGW